MKFIATLLTLIILSLGQQKAIAQIGADFCFIHIIDQAHKENLAAGVQHDNNVYHQEHKNRDVAEWQFIPVGNGYYNIIDRSHGKALVAGYNYDGRVYHQDPKGQPTAEWKLVPVGTDNTFHIIDRKHNKALVAGVVNDNNVYHQNPGNKKNAIWKLEVTEGNGKTPKEMVISEKFHQITYHYDRLVQKGEPQRIILENSYRNSTNLQQKQIIKASRKLNAVETWSFSESILTSIANSLTTAVQVGIKKLGISTQIQHSVEFKTEKSSTKTKGGSKTTEILLAFENQVNVPANDLTTCSQMITYTVADIPFTVESTRTFGDGSSKLVKYDGVWRGNSYGKSEVECYSKNNGHPPAVSTTSPAPTTQPTGQPVVQTPVGMNGQPIAYQGNPNVMGGRPTANTTPGTNGNETWELDENLMDETYDEWDEEDEYPTDDETNYSENWGDESAILSSTDFSPASMYLIKSSIWPTHAIGGDQSGAGLISVEENGQPVNCTFRVHQTGEGQLMFELVEFPGNFLQWANDRFIVGSGDKSGSMFTQHVGGNELTYLELTNFPGYYLMHGEQGVYLGQYEESQAFYAGAAFNIIPAQ
ncbi:MAG: RICIN domain-containing protein [Bacteroidota bacterium]